MTKPEPAPVHLRAGMTVGAMYAVIGLALLLIAGAVFNVYLWNSSRTTRAELRAERLARLTQRQQDERSNGISRVVQCRQSIPTLREANAVIDDLRSQHLASARSAEALAKVDPNAALRRLHEQIAVVQLQKARALRNFPTVTNTQCDELARSLLGPGWRKIVMPPKRTQP